MPTMLASPLEKNVSHRVTDFYPAAQTMLEILCRLFTLLHLFGTIAVFSPESSLIACLAGFRGSCDSIMFHSLS